MIVSGTHVMEADRVGLHAQGAIPKEGRVERAAALDGDAVGAIVCASHGLAGIVGQGNRVAQVIVVVVAGGVRRVAGSGALLKLVEQDGAVDVEGARAVGPDAPEHARQRAVRLVHELRRLPALRVPGAQSFRIVGVSPPARPACEVVALVPA